MFSDLNRYAIKPTKSINILFNSREESSIIAKAVIEKADVFKGLVEKEKTTISNRAKALFTLSAICTATTELLKDSDEDTNGKIRLAVQFWNHVGEHIPEWNMVRDGSKKPSDVRKESICTLSITLVALGTAGRALIATHPDNWKEQLSVLDRIDWRKTNPKWNDLVFINGRVAANRSTQHAMSSYIKRIILQG